MKHTFKKLMAVLLAAIMTLTMAASVFAAAQVTPKQGTLEVNANQTGATLQGQTINIYKLFDLKPAATGNGGSYTVNETFKEQLVTALNKVASTTYDPTVATSEVLYQAVVDKVGNLKVQGFANEFTKAVVTTLPEKPVPTHTFKVLTEVASHTFQNVDYGYYLVYQTGTQAFQSSLVNVKDATNTVSLKGLTPGITKTADKKTTSIGEVVTYTITGTIPDTTGFNNYSYVIHDELTAGLDFVKDSTGAALDGSGTSVSVNVTVDTTITPQTATVAGRKMTLDLSQWIKENQANVGKTFTVTYYAKVNKDAVVTNTENKAQLEYSNNPYDETSKVTTPPNIVKTPTFPLDINKIDGADDKTLLAGAKFKIFKETTPGQYDEANPIEVTPGTSGTSGSYVVADPQDQLGATVEMETVQTAISGKGNLHLNGLAAGTYYLVETQAPEGYNKLTEAIKVTITRIADDKQGNVQYTVTKGTVEEIDKVIDVENNSGSLLPPTGGMNTVIFTVVAVVLILGVAISFVRSRKAEKK